MPDVEVAVTFQPLGRTVFVLPGTWLVEAAALAGLAFEMPCGGEGICGKCRVVVRRGAGDPTEDERNHLTADELAAGARLACRTPVVGPMTVFVPATSVVGDGHQILTTTAESPAARLHPAVRKRYLELPPPG
ncbi:MAG: 2Fe-2S iron-sulfur cluster binding domain-containing protein, partial [Thermoguttaceae bacterium]|nr:2Fe-2S iron-sulfur cluster binding domain-containing protein [Thermoguttaceae bacterium]